MPNAPISRSASTLERSLQWYRRLTRVPTGYQTRRAWLTARENQRSALPILRAGIRHAAYVEYLMTSIAAAAHPISMRDLDTRDYPYACLATTMSVLQQQLARSHMRWFECTRRITTHGGLEHGYRLTPFAQQLMQARMTD